MREKTRSTREAWGEAIVLAVEAIVREQGVAAVNAREVARRADVAVGTLYLVFGTLDAAVSAANARTLARIDAAMGDAVAGLSVPLGDADEPLATCRALAHCYVAFALAERNAWAALFEFNPRDKSVLAVHEEALRALVGRVVSPLARVRPDMGLADVELRARTFFGAVHGVVHMALEGWFFGAPRERLGVEVDALVRAMVRGLALA